LKPPVPTTRIAIGLGSNLGGRLENLRFGLSRLRLTLQGVRASSVYETEPAHDPDQPMFLNACVTGRTRLTPLQLLSELQDVERRAGRRRRGPRFGPRELDLDLLLYGDQALESDCLTLPHPRIRERAFVLVPLAEIAPDWIVAGEPGEAPATVCELAGRVDRDGVRQTRHRLK
jgi:2-amino-4-hydroxy-6-hydroxymethyldihydropteridine diphosphokinase